MHCHRKALGLGSDPLDVADRKHFPEKKRNTIKQNPKEQYIFN